jgi:hypothetical protein
VSRRNLLKDFDHANRTHQIVKSNNVVDHQQIFFQELSPGERREQR